MRVQLRICAVLVGLGASLPAHATVFLNVSIDGTLTGTTTTILCNSGSSPDCLTTYPGGLLTAPFEEPFSVALGAIGLEEGDNNFSFGSTYSFGSYQGVINNTGGVLMGRDLQFSRTDSSCHFGNVGCQWVFASAPVFNVAGGIPEPATWLLMLLGFGGVGTVLRRARPATRVTKPLPS